MKGMKMNSMFRWIVVVLGVATALFAFTMEASAQNHEGYLYGKVYIGDRVYTGPIRWGTEEVLWTDIFNAAKADDRYQKMIPKKKDNDDSWFNYDWTIGGIWEDKVVSHRFTCQFGNISVLERHGESRAVLKFKNGAELVIDGNGYNDMSSKIQIIDDELGVISLNWERVSKIEFMQAPKRLETVFGTPLFGTVEGARKEKFTGYIVWDDDERVSTDRLDGDEDNRDVSLKFGEVASIEKQGRGSEVTLKSGKSYYLTNSNDVNSENRGVLVVVPEVGVVRLKWDAFRKVTFTEPSKPIQTYEQFSKPTVLRGTVTRLDGDDVSGQIVYDIDETLNFEVLEGDENNIEYIIPFKNIKRITPKNSEFSSIELRNGQTLLLGSAQDVSVKNNGILVFEKGKKEPVYIRWREINDITFD